MMALRFVRLAGRMAIVGVLAFVGGCGEPARVGVDLSIRLLGPPAFASMPVPMRPLADLERRIALSSSSPTYSLDLSEFDAQSWTALFVAQQLAEGEVPEGHRIQMSMDNVSFEGDAVTISVRIVATEGLIVGRDADYVPTAPDVCTFGLDRNSSGDDYARGVNECLTAWISDNGSPVGFGMEVTATPVAAAGSPSFEPGVNPQQFEESFRYTGDWTMRSTNPCALSSPSAGLRNIRDPDFLNRIECETLEVRGAGETDFPIDIAGATASWDACGNATVAGLRPTSLASGAFTVAEEGSGSAESQNVVPVVLLPDDITFTERALAFGRESCSGPNTTPTMQARTLSRWSQCGPIDPPEVPTETMTVDAASFCTLAATPETETPAESDDEEG